MRYVKQKLTDYTSTTIVESVPLWNSATSYNVGDEVLFDKYIWKNSLVSNINNVPSTSSNYWVRWSSSNKYALLDLNSTSYTQGASNASLEFPLGIIDTLVLGYVTAKSVTIQNINDAGDILYTQTYIQSVNDYVFDYYDYIYADYSLAFDRSMFFDIYRIGTKVRVSFEVDTVNVGKFAIGYMVVGSYQDMGKTKDDVKIGFKSYSLKATDDFGTTLITKRSAQDYIDFETTIQSSLMTDLRRKIKSNKDETMAFIVDEKKESIYENIITLAVAQDMNIVASNSDITILTWSLIEMI